MKRTYHHGDLRTALIEVGLRLLGDREADDLSLREVARAVGVSATAVYRHFPDKGALMSALAQEGLRELAEAQHAAAEAAGGGGPGFLATGRAYVDFALAKPALFRLIFTSPAPHDLLSDEARTVPEAMSFLRANAASLAPAGSGDITVRAIALRGWALAHGLAMLMLDGQAPVEPALIDAGMSPSGELAA